MKFFDFINYAYYALICAETEQKAMACYAEYVADIEDGNGPPKELTLDEAREKFLSCCKSEKYKNRSLTEFNRRIKHNEPDVLLIDGCLT